MIYWVVSIYKYKDDESYNYVGHKNFRLQNNAEIWLKKEGYEKTGVSDDGYDYDYKKKHATLTTIIVEFEDTREGGLK